MGHVFVTRALPGRAVEMLEKAGHTLDVWAGELPPPRTALLERLPVADAALTMVTDRCDGEILEAARRLRIIANMAVGYDNVEPAGAAARGIWLTNTPGVLAETTADFAFGLLLAVARRISESDRHTRAGGWKTWSPTAFLGPDVHGATLGILGLGEIGTAMARRGRGFGMPILYHNRNRNMAAEAELGAEYVEFDDLLSRSDFVSVHVPLTEKTHHMLGVVEFGLMRPGAVLVNTARGGVIEQDELVDALANGSLGGVGLDVTDPEPLPLDHRLYSFENVVITPHIGSAGTVTRARMAEMAAANIIAALAGEEPPNAVNKPIRRRL